MPPIYAMRPTNKATVSLGEILNKNGNNVHKPAKTATVAKRLASRFVLAFLTTKKADPAHDTNEVREENE